MSVKILMFTLLTAASLGCQAEYNGPFLTVESLMEFINDTSDVYIPPVNKKPPDLLISTEEDIQRAGYPVEVHKVYTEDGQMVSLRRIPGPSWAQGDLAYRSRQPVLIMHGILGSSQIFILTPPHKALPYLLVEAGYDVWIGDFRGNYYSRSHLKYSTKDRRFWDFSPHEMGVYDLPAMIDHIILMTGFPQITYIGHSMGTTAFLVMASMKPEYNSKVMASFLLAPVALAITGNQLPPLLAVATQAADLIYKSAVKLRLYEFLPKNEYLYKILDSTCGPGPFQRICLEMNALSVGENRENINLTDFGRYSARLIAGTSAKTVYHMAQLFVTGNFRMFNYGAKANLYKYGRSVPPDYPLDRVTVPVYIYYGLNDILMNPEVIERLAQTLPNVVHVSAVQDPKFNHLDFLYGINAKDLLYDKIISQLNSINQFHIRNTINKFNQFHINKFDFLN